MVKFLRLVNKTVRVDGAFNIIGSVNVYEEDKDRVILLLEYSEDSFIEIILDKRKAKSLKEALEYVL